MKEELILKLIEMLVDSKEDVNDTGFKIAKSFVGKFVICRSENEGINAGTVVEMDETGVVLENVRRLWHHRPKDVSLSWYEGVAQSGLSDDSKVSCTTESKAIIEEYSLTLCSKVAEQSIMGVSPHAQN